MGQGFRTETSRPQQAQCKVIHCLQVWLLHQRPCIIQMSTLPSHHTVGRQHSSKQVSGSKQIQELIPL